MTLVDIPKIPLAYPYSDGEWSNHSLADGYAHIKHDGRLLTIYTKIWYEDDGPRMDEGEERDPDEEFTEVYLDATPVFVVQELRRRGVEFGAHATVVGDIAELPDGTTEYFVAGHGRPLARAEQVTAFLHGFTPKQLEVINAHVDARP